MRSSARFLPVICAVMIAALFSAPAYAAESKDSGRLSYCVSSHDNIPRNRMDDFIVDYMLARDGSVKISLFEDKAEGKALHAWTIKREGNVPAMFNWDGIISGKLIGPGSYVLRFAAGDRAEDIADIAFEVTSPSDPLPLAVTGPGGYLPKSMDTKSVWQAMTAPMAVADAGDLSHEPIYDRPGGKKIGHVHGQTAGLIIRELDPDGWARVGAWGTVDGSYIEGYIRQDRLKMVEPNPRWGLLIDKAAQKMHVYEADESAAQGVKLLGILNISTGLMARNKLFRETRAGAFVTQKRIASFSSDGYRYDYAIRIDGGNLIHEMGHQLIGGKKAFTGQTPQLGTKASSGCVRVDPIPGDHGMNARWLWQNLPRGTKVLVLDDPQARMSRLEEIGGIPPLASGAQPGDTILIPASAEDPFTVPEDPSVMSIEETPVQPAEETAQALEIIATEPPKSGPVRLTMTFTGDSILGSEEKSRKLPESFDSFIAEKGYAWPFSGLYDLLSADDLSIINLEGVLKDDTRGRQQGKLHWFRGPTSFAGILPAGSIELAGLANNHMRDYGIAGHNSTRKALKAAGIPYFGYGDTYIHEHQGLKIGFGGIRETIWRQKPGLPGEEIAALREAGCDYIVYTIHAGKEYSRTHNELQEKIARSVIDAGADIVIGMHPHVVQGIEKYKDGLIVYSLGNFSFGGNLKLTEFDGLAVQVILDFEGRELKETTLKLIPVLTTGTKPANDFRPIPARGEDKERILKLVQDDSPELKIREVMTFSR